MKVAALFSGGKDSTYAIHVAKNWGWDVTHLVTVKPAASDSHMFHVPNLHLTPLLSEALGIPLVTRDTPGEKEHELDALRDALAGLDIDGIVSGAVASEYQRTRVDRVCHELGIRSYAPLWHKDPRHLLDSIIAGGFDARIVACAADGLDETWLGRRIDPEAVAALERLHVTNGIHIGGEGGEYESLVLDGPDFEARLRIGKSSKEWRRDSGILTVEEATLVPKTSRPRQRVAK
ncbi:MAG: TIGR00289 family protein [Euryarchaeota archaeon]|nr:TIGR00289 family protein [Euryarchaeota archaeon]